MSGRDRIVRDKYVVVPMSQEAQDCWSGQTGIESKRSRCNEHNGTTEGHRKEGLPNASGFKNIKGLTHLVLSIALIKTLPFAMEAPGTISCCL